MASRSSGRVQGTAGRAGVDLLAVEPQAQRELTLYQNELAGDAAPSVAVQKAADRGNDAVDRYADRRHDDIRGFAPQRNLKSARWGIRPHYHGAHGVAQPAAATAGA